MKMPDIEKIVMKNGGKPAKLYLIHYIVMGDKMQGEVRRESAYGIPALLYSLYQIFEHNNIYGLEIIPIYTVEQAREYRDNNGVLED